MNTRPILLWTVFATALAVSAESQVPGGPGPDTVVIQSGALTLRGLL